MDCVPDCGPHLLKVNMFINSVSVLFADSISISKATEPKHVCRVSPNHKCESKTEL